MNARKIKSFFIHKLRPIAIGGQITVLLFAVSLPMLNFSAAEAAQLTSRSVTISSSKPSASGLTYTYGFTTPATTAIQSIGFQACTTPINTCTSPGGTIDMNNASVAEASRSGWTNATVFTRAAGSGGCTGAVNMLCVTRTQAATETAGARTLGFNLQTNPTALGSYYIRIITYSDTAWATPVDTGTVAYAIVNQLTVSARVQEVLSFCVGTTTVNDATSSTGADCSAISGTSVNIGVISSSAISTSPVAVSPNDGNNVNGVAMIRTNATNGTVVTYFAEQDTSSGKLKVVGATCSGTSVTDQCVNNSTTQATFTAGTENFGMTVAGVNCGSVPAPSYSCVFASGTNNLKQVSNYIGATTTTYGVTTGFAWQDSGATTTIASTTGSTKVIDDEALILRFAATAQATTPTGSYAVTSTYVATSTY